MNYILELEVEIARACRAVVVIESSRRKKRCGFTPCEQCDKEFSRADNRGVLRHDKNCLLSGVSRQAATSVLAALGKRRGQGCPNFRSVRLFGCLITSACFAVLCVFALSIGH